MKYPADLVANLEEIDEHEAESGRVNQRTGEQGGAVVVERPGIRRLGRRLVAPVLVALGIFLALALVADVRELRSALDRLDARILIPVFGLSVVNYVLRYVRWEYYLRALDVRLPRLPSVAIFLVGFALSITPGKAGELGKAWLVRELGGGPARRVVPVVLCERIVDLLAMVLLIALGSITYAGGRLYAWVGVILFVGMIALISSERAMTRFLQWASRLPAVGDRIHMAEEVWDRARQLLRPDRLLVAVVLSVVAWGAEGIGCYLVLLAYSTEVSWLAAVFTYSFSTLIAALSMLPGGLLAAEGSLTALLDLQGLSLAEASAATMVIRVATLWFAVVLGLLAAPYLIRLLRRNASTRPTGTEPR